MIILLHSSFDENDETKVTQMGVEDQQNHMKILAFLWWNTDVFAFTTFGIPGIDLELMTHHLNVTLLPSQWQKKRPMT